MEIKILNVQWFNDIGMVTIDNGYEIKTYIKKVKCLDEKEDIQDIINTGYKVYPVQLERIVNLHKEGE